MESFTLIGETESKANVMTDELWQEYFELPRDQLAGLVDNEGKPLTEEEP